MEKNKWKVFIRTQSYLKPYLIPYIFFVFVSGLGQFLTFSSVGVFLKEILLLVSSKNTDFTIQKGILYLFGTFLFTCLMGFGIFNIKKIEQKIRVKLRQEMIDSYIHSDEKEVENISDKEVLNRMSMDLTKMVDLVGWIMAGSIYMPVISGFLSVIYLWYVDYRIAMLCIIVSIIEYFLLRMFSQKRAHAMEEMTLEKNTIVNFLNEDGYEEEYQHLLSICKIHDFLDDDQMILEKNGSNLSGGQKQRISLARALLNHKDVILFDESFSGIDSNNALEILQNIMKEYPKETMVFTIHQLELLKEMNRIVVMDNGSIVFDGTYQEYEAKYGKE